MWGWRGPPHRAKQGRLCDACTPPPPPQPQAPALQAPCVWTQLAKVRLPPAPSGASRPQIDARRRQGSHVLAFQGRVPSRSVPSPVRLIKSTRLSFTWQMFSIYWASQCAQHIHHSLGRRLYQTASTETSHPRHSNRNALQGSRGLVHRSVLRVALAE